MTFERACAVTDIPDEGALATEIDGEPVALVRSQGEVFAISDICSHADVPLS
jgi:3-phenylpropionate/trans-cinnamate dioxygenase ferredoxin subunit